MSKLNEKKKTRSGIESHKIKQVQQAEEKQHLLKAAKQEELLLKGIKKEKTNKFENDTANPLDRFKTKLRK